MNELRIVMVLTRIARHDLEYSNSMDVAGIRELSKSGRHQEALAAAEALAGAAPRDRDLLYLTAANLRCLNRIADALAALQCLEQLHPSYGLLHQERGHCYMSLRDAPRAIEAFEQAVNRNPALTTSWTMLERLYRMTGASEKAVAAAGQLATLNQLPPDVVRAGSLFLDCDWSAAAMILRAFLRDNENHVEALRLLGAVEHKRGLLNRAEGLFQAALKLAPDYRDARVDYIHLLIDRQKYLPARDETAPLLTADPDNQYCLSLQAAACAGLGQHESAIAAYSRLLALSPDSPELHVSMGHSLRSLGQQQAAISSYKTAAALRNSFGDAWWSLANLKTYRFASDEIVSMRDAEALPAAEPVDRAPLCFALGKAYEEGRDYAQSWRFYERGNQLKRSGSLYRPEITEAEIRRQIDVCTADFFLRRSGFGVPDPDPIFIVGLPRSGSTLIEQILASHSKIGATQELADLPRIVHELQDEAFQGEISDEGDSQYTRVLPELTSDDFHRLGESYLEGARAFRGTKPFFIDKMPNNFRNIGLIQLMLPNARIIDVRREPIACCFSNLKQLFARGQEFIYSAEDIARYYLSYLKLMRHWDAVLPGRVLRVWYEDVVDDLEANVKRILHFCGLTFELACIEFHRTERSIQTASSEQVRLPIFREGLDQWRNYEPWLGPLRESLGDALVRYRE